jgi:hypothetical protein
VAEVVVPDALVDERARQHLPRVPEEELEEVRLGRRQLEAATRPARVHRAEVEREVGEAEHVARRLRLRAAEQSPQPREQLFEVVRLRR